MQSEHTYKQYDALDGNFVTLTFSRITRDIIPTFKTPQESNKQSQQEVQPTQETSIEVNSNVFSSIWIKIPLVVFVLVLAFYFRYYRFKKSV